MITVLAIFAVTAIATTAFSFSIFARHKAAMVKCMDITIQHYKDMLADSLGEVGFYTRYDNADLRAKYEGMAATYASLIYEAKRHKAAIIKATAVYAVMNMQPAPIARIMA